MIGQIRTIYKDKGYGFIRIQTSREEFFFHSSSCSESFDTLNNGMKVEFESVPGSKGPRAENVRIVK